MSFLEASPTHSDEEITEIVEITKREFFNNSESSVPNPSRRPTLENVEVAHDQDFLIKDDDDLGDSDGTIDWSSEDSWTVRDIQTGFTNLRVYCRYQ